MRRVRPAVAGLISLLFFGTLTAGESTDLVRIQAQLGDLESQLKLADEFFFGRNRQGNLTLAVFWYRKAAEQGSPLGRYNLAVCQEQGWGVDRNVAAAYVNFEQAAQAGLPQAKLNLALLLFKGVESTKSDKESLPGVAANPAKAIQMLRELVREEFAPARFVLANLLFNDSKLRQKHGGEIRTLLETACKDENADAAALLLLAVCYREGIGGLIDLKAAADNLERACNLGSAVGMARYAEALDFGLGRAIDRKKAFELSKKAADLGAPLGQLRLGDYYLQGEFLPHDPAAAFAQFLRAAEQNYPPAFLRLGNAFALGIGVEKDEYRAFAEFFKAAQAGEPAGQYQLGRCLLYGIGVEANQPEAVAYFRKAVGRGNLDAMRELGNCLLTGRGVEQNKEEGLLLLKAAASSGDSEAARILEQNN